jgi:hypothetical protein
MNSFADWIWITLWWFIFIAYLMILFQILSDIFRDQELSGWSKAAWVIGLLFIPFLIALIYLISRGDGMARRRANDMRQAQADTDAYIRDVASSSSPADQIHKAKALLDSGAIDANEFAALKAKALS